MKSNDSLIGKQVVNMGYADLDEQLRNALAAAYTALYGGRTTETRAQALRHTRTFAQYLSKHQAVRPLPDNLLFNYKKYVLELSYSSDYKAQIHQCAVRLLRWIDRNTEGLTLAPQENASARLFQRRSKVCPACIGEVELKAILRAAYKDINDVEARLQSAWEQIEVGNFPNLDVIVRLLRGKMLPPLKEQRELDGSLKRQVERLGGLREIRKTLFPAPSDIFPYYIAILCQCSGNPMAIQHLSRDCVNSHPIQPDRQRIVWNKPRSNTQQKADFNVSKSNSAPNLVKRLIQLNAKLVAISIDRDKNKLFLAYSAAGVAVPSWQTFHDLHQAFIAKHGLPPHLLKDFRKAGAELHTLAAGTILRAKSRLNHQSVQTTRTYVSSSILEEIHSDKIAEHQGRLHEMVAGLSSVRVEPPAPQVSRGNANTSAETVFGFVCKDPWAGVQRGEEGRRCLKFTGCATCPGSIVTLDDKNVVAKLLAAASQLNEAQGRAAKEGWLDRYIDLYASTLDIIENQLLPKVSRPIMELAKQEFSKKQVLFLE